MKLKHQRRIEKAVFGINVEEIDKSLLYRHGLCALSFFVSGAYRKDKVFPLSTTYFKDIIGVRIIGRMCNNWVIETTGMMPQESIQVANEALDIGLTVICFKFVGL